MFQKFVFGVLLVSASLWAQTSQINGVVKDTSGSVIASATVKATQTATGVVRTTTSGADGGYVLPNLPTGPYMVEVTKEGFSRSVQTGIVLEVASSSTVDVSMKIGAVSEQVTVEANAMQVETRTNSIGQVVDNARIMEMPLNGRDVHSLIFLAGMASFPGNNSLQSVRNYPTVVVTVAGGMPDSVAYNLDGIVHQDPYNNLSLPLPFPDAVQEFKVEWSASAPQYGFHSTATVNAATKSGTNQFHGDLFEFLRNGDLNANDFFNNAAIPFKPRDTYKRNQFGGVIGGPVIKDKLFFFGGYQRTSLRSDGSAATAFIPIPAMATGDFSSIKTPLPAALGFSPGNQISPTLLDKTALNIFKTIPATSDPTGRTSYSTVGNQDEDLFTARMDYQVNSKHQVFGRVLSAKLKQGSSYDGKNPLTIANYGLDDLVYGVALGDTWVISPSLVSSFRVGANRTNIAKVPDQYGSFKDFGANVSPLGGKNIAVTVTGDFLIGGGGAAPGESHNGPLWSINQDFNWVKGSHQIGFGGAIYHQQLNYWSAGGVNSTGLATFDASTASKNALVNFMLGVPTSWSQGTLYGYYSRQYYAALYVQDNWKIGRRLTLNYGVRWEPYMAVHQKYDHQDLHFDPALFTQNVRSTFYQNAPAGLVFSGDPQYTCGNAFNCPKWDKFFPRIGLAWDPKGDGRMTIRVGYGMFGDRMSMLSLSQEQFGPPFGNRIDFPAASLTDPWANFPGGAGGLLPPGQNPMAILAARTGFGSVRPDIPFVTRGTYISSPLSDFKPTYVNQYNVSIQRQVGKDWLLSANLLATSTIHMVSGSNLNPAVFIPGSSATPTGCPAALDGTFPRSCIPNQDLRRPLYLQDAAKGQYYSGIGLLDDGGTATYDGLNLSAQKRLSHGINVLVNYTWSHCISDQWFQNPTAGNGNSIPGNRRAWRSNCQGLDQRQLFQVSMVGTTPKFNNRIARILGSDWQFAPNLEIKSSQFFTVITGSDVALTTTPQQTPNLLNTNPYPANQSVDKWITSTATGIRADLRDTSPAFANAPLGSYGNLGYNNMKGPGVFQLNIAVSRNFRIREGHTLQVRAEAFNLPNHLNPGTPGGVSAVNFGGIATLSAPNFGQITNDISGTNGGLIPGDYRVVQLAMKYIF
jgi:hypothetical protein